MKYLKTLKALESRASSSSYLSSVIAKFQIDTKKGQVTIEGPTWVKPTYEKFLEEYKNEDEEWYETIKKVNGLKKLYDSGKAVVVSRTKVKKLDVTDPTSNIPVEWLLDPKEKPDFEWDAYTYRYSSRHHKDVLKIFREGGQLDMPIYVGNVIISGRHRVTYARSLGIPITIFQMDEDLAYELFEEGEAKA